jgi:hypothetical protein
MEIPNRCLASWELHLDEYERKIDSFERGIS